MTKYHGGTCVSAQSRPKLGSDAGSWLHDAGMDGQELIRAAEITLRRAILKHLPPGPEREEWLRWLEQAVSERRSFYDTRLEPGRGG